MAAEPVVLRGGPPSGVPGRGPPAATGLLRQPWAAYVLGHDSCCIEMAEGPVLYVDAVRTLPDALGRLEELFNGATRRKLWELLTEVRDPDSPVEALRRFHNYAGFAMLGTRLRPWWTLGQVVGRLAYSATYRAEWCPPSCLSHVEFAPLDAALRGLPSAAYDAVPILRRYIDLPSERGSCRMTEFLAHLSGWQGREYPLITDYRGLIGLDRQLRRSLAIVQVDLRADEDALHTPAATSLTAPALEPGAMALTPALAATAAAPRTIRLQVDREGPVAMRDGKPHALTEPQAVYLAALQKAGREWQSDSEVRESEPILDGVRVDRVRKSLPAELLDLIETHRSRGSRLKEGVVE